MCDEKKLQEWEELAKKATPGPWAREGGYPPMVVTNAPYSSLCESRLLKKENGEVIGEYLGVCLNANYDASWLQSWDDLAFIAITREAVPALIAEVRRLRALYISVKDKGG